MDPRTVIAQRIDLHLRRQLGEAVDLQRALNDEAYKRDLLLVCDAMKGTELPLLARQFRVAGERYEAERHQFEPAGCHAGPPQDWGTDTSGFGLSRPLPLAEPEKKVPKPSWFLPSRWL
ncbi:MAG: hypothetical protein OEU94_10260 [Aquincola sp.]|nr:hypothetical protein [Aquincola sp.]MDH4287664.1 hypothetical protein [Aquincola sp.]MDH5328339.1 hypothetical protein [Aquincola sp.]